MAKLSTAAIQGFSMPQPVTSSGSTSGRATPRRNLVHEAKLALEEPDEWNLAAIEMREIDAAAEDATSRVFGVVHRPPAQHCDVTLRIEDCHIDTNLHSADRGLVLGIEEARVGHDEMDGAAVALEANRAEIKRTVRRQLGERLLGLRSRQQHRVAEMPPRLIMREDVRDQNALVDLEAVLVALEHVLFRRDLCALGHKPRKRIGSSKQEFFHPHEASHAMGDGAVDRARMRARNRSRDSRARTQIASA